MSRILIDLTDLELWGGQHGGTQRVVYGLAKHFYLAKDQLGQEVQFITFSDRAKAFKLTSFTPIFERVESGISSPAGGIYTQTLSLKTRLKHRIRPYVPEKIRRSETVRKIAQQSLKTVSRAARVTKKQLASQRENLINKSPSVDFRKDDIVLIAGKPWDNPNIQKVLARQKIQTDFKLVQVVYDLIISLQPQLHHPSLFKAYTQNIFEAASISDLLLPISKSSDRDLKEFCAKLSIPEPKTRVIRLGDEQDDTADALKPDDRVADRFIACVGTIEIRKNHALLYYTYKLAGEQGIDLPQLVIIGGRGWLSGDLQYLLENDPVVKDKILILDNVNDNGLKWIYQNCSFTIYPSMYEGWGLPVAEALAYGKFCLASNSSSIPEIAGDLIDYFSPYDTQECLAKISQYSNDEDALKRREEAIIEHYRKTAWGQTYKEVLEGVKRL